MSVQIIARKVHQVRKTYSAYSTFVVNKRTYNLSLTIRKKNLGLSLTTNRFTRTNH